MRLSKLLFIAVVAAFFTMSQTSVHAQGSATMETETRVDPEEQAHRFLGEQKFDSAITIYKDLYQKTPDKFYNEYLDALIKAKKFKEAESLSQGRFGNPNQSTVPEIDFGKILKLEGKDKKATEQFETVLNKINGDDFVTQRIAKAFDDAGEPAYALKTYRKATAIFGNSPIYCIQIGNTLNKMGMLDSAIDAMLSTNVRMFLQPESLKTIFLQWMGNDPVKIQTCQKFLVAKITKEPDNIFLAEMLTWVYTMRDDWDGALIQMEAIDERNQENGFRLFNFAHLAVAAKQYEFAIKAFDDIIAKGEDKPNTTIARNEKMNVGLTRLKNEPNPSKAQITDLVTQFNQFFNNFPKFYSQPLVEDYAMVMTEFADSIERGMQILKRGIDDPETRKEVAASFKLQLGDYYLIKGKIWDASLLYSQVDKDFKQDFLGEMARFKNAKLAYYRGDFEYAQFLLHVLKASTSELIANDALLLSVQITENVEDSFYIPLSRFAYAGLLLSENKDSLSEVLLDSIAQAFPKHPLNDDILMQHAKIAVKHHNFEKAMVWLKLIVEKYGQDVLADDAILMEAEISLNNFGKKEEAKKLYEQLIIDYPGSTLIQIARNRLAELNGRP